MFILFFELFKMWNQKKTSYVFVRYYIKFVQDFRKKKLRRLIWNLVI